MHNIFKLKDTMKEVLIEKLIALSAFKKNLEEFHTSDLTEHLKALEQREKTLPRGIDGRK